MNFLAHTYLSGDNNKLLIGNFIADMLRGSEVELYEKEIKEGILLHRFIDHYTDSHPLVKECIEILKPSQKRYSPVIADICFDHFLAKNWSRFSNEDLGDYCLKVYNLMHENIAILPERFQRILHRMVVDNWLEGYKTVDGVNNAFEGTARLAKFESNMANAKADLLDHYDFLEGKFLIFFEDLIQEVKKKGVQFK